MDTSNTQDLTEKYYNKLLVGNAIDIIKELPDEFIDMVVTSPPYWGLRKYGGHVSIFGGDRNCDHKFELKKTSVGHANNQGIGSKVISPMYNLIGSLDTVCGFCVKCNAWQGEFGLEPTFSLYIEHLLLLFREIKRVLKKTGTCWVNIGDTYYTTNRGNEIADKSLCMIPYRFAIGMQEDGWILRNVIIWRKMNCLPQSAVDRFTVDYEPIFFFTKNKKYFFNTQFEPISESTYKRVFARNNADKRKCGHNPVYAISFVSQCKARAKLRSVIERGEIPMRRKRCVWDVNTRPHFGIKHFAIYPKKLIEPMIDAGCPPKGVVLDPFIGSGTTAIVAKSMDRNYIGIDINPEYIKMASERISKEVDNN